MKTETEPKTKRIDGTTWHRLKIWRFPFLQVMSGAKTFEIRQDDRGFLTGDFLILEEWDHEKETYTGRTVTRQVQYISHGPDWGLPRGMVVMAIRQI